MTPEEASLATIDPRIDLNTMFHGTVKDPDIWMDIGTRQNPYLAGIGPERTAQVIKDLDRILTEAGLLPEGMSSRALFDAINDNKHPIPADIKKILGQTVGDGPFAKMEAAFRIVWAEASREAFNKVMVEEVFPYLKEKYANHKRPWLMEKPPTGPDAEEVILKYIQNRQIKYSEGVITGISTLPRYSLGMSTRAIFLL